MIYLTRNLTVVELSSIVRDWDEFPVRLQMNGWTFWNIHRYTYRNIIHMYAPHFLYVVCQSHNIALFSVICLAQSLLKSRMLLADNSIGCVVVKWWKQPTIWITTCTVVILPPGCSTSDFFILLPFYTNTWWLEGLPTRNDTSCKT